MGKIDTSWKWRNRVKKRVPKKVPHNSKIRVFVSRKFEDYLATAPFTEFEIKIDNMSGTNLIYGFHNGGPHSRNAYIRTYALMWNNHVIEKRWYDYSKSERENIIKKFEEELNSVKDEWVQAESIRSEPQFYFELYFNGNEIVDIVPIEDPYS